MSGDQVGVAARVQLLRRWQPSCTEHPGVGDGLPTILGAIGDDVLDGSVDLIISEVVHTGIIAISR